MVILIADDDKLIRFTMKSMLSSILCPGFVYFEAADGNELVSLCQKHMPDIAFVDIKMPYLDGISAIESCRHLTPDTEFVIISGYSDFEYAKRCLSLGVSEYILKPVEEAQLAAIIASFHKKRTHSLIQSNSRFQLSILNLFNYFSTLGMDEEYTEPALSELESYFIYGTYIIGDPQSMELSRSYQKELIKNINEFGDSLLGFDCSHCLLYSNDGTPYFIFKAPLQLESRIMDGMKKLYFFRQIGELNVAIVYFKERSLSQIFLSCSFWDRHHYYLMNFANTSIIDARSLKFSQAECKIMKHVQLCINAYQNAEEVKYKETINNLYRLYKDVAHNLNLKNISCYVNRLTGHEINWISFKNFCRSFIDMGMGMYRKVEISDIDLTEQIKTYIHQNYMYGISISEIAEKFNLTPNYLSGLFHRKADCKLIDFITEVRISNSKRLLIKNNTASIRDIAIMVGYTSPRHFSTIFQKSTGITPSAYRKEFTGS